MYEQEDIEQMISHLSDMCYESKYADRVVEKLIRQFKNCKTNKDYFEYEHSVKCFGECFRYLTSKQKIL